MIRLRRLCLSICTGLLPAVALAYNPPVDTAGPLTVRIEAAETLTQVDTPTAGRVVLENKGDKAIRGTLRLGVVDRWKIEPAEAAFDLPAGKSLTKDFTLSAGQPTYSAHYPIHAYAKFESDGKTHEAHPILIFEAKLPPVKRERPKLAWTPFSLAADSELALWRLPVRRAVVQVFGQKPETMPVGWEGNHAENKATVSVNEQVVAGQKRECVGIHPPWASGKVGTALIEFPIALPDKKPIKLRFAAAMTPYGEGGGDGVAFRVRVAELDAPAGEFGKIVFERQTTEKKWLDLEADLSQFAGRKVRVQLEGHPGPKNDTSFDHSFWAEPTLVAGTPPKTKHFPFKDSDGREFTIHTDRKGPIAWTGRRGLLDVMFNVGDAQQPLYFNGFEIRVFGIRLDDARSPVQLMGVDDESDGKQTQCRHKFQTPYGNFDLLGRVWTDNGMLRVKWWLENTPAPQPWLVCRIEDAATGPWSDGLKRVYAGHGNVVEKPEAFTMNFDGHRLSTSFVGFEFADGAGILQAVDVPPDRLEIRPDRKHFSLHATHAPTFTFVTSKNAFDAVKHWREHNGIKPAGGVKKLAGRFVFDLWGGRYGESADSLKRAFAYGLTDSCVVWHNWQRWGYDYRLPDIMPPNPKLGTPEEFKRLADLCREHKVLFAPHDNYIDFYPDADEFSYEKQIAFSPGGEPVKAWLNEGRGARSYRFRADTLAPFVKRNVEWLKREYQPTGYFIDVWSSIDPYDYWTADGKFFDRVYTNRVWAEQFAWIRQTLGDDAPQISESGHDGQIGYLDGAQTNHLRIGTGTGHHAWSAIPWKCADAERTPWFDVAHHDRFILHGAGYSARYEAGLDPRLHGIFSDDYISTEVLTGHPAMVPHAFGRDVVRKYWLLHDLMRALALQTIQSVEYVDGDLHRQHIRWSLGEVWINRGEKDWRVSTKRILGNALLGPAREYDLPQYGFVAWASPVDGLVLAAVERRDGVIVESANLVKDGRLQSLYVNGRQPIESALNVQLKVEKVEVTKGRHAELKLVWQLNDAVPDEYQPFLHLCDAAGEIITQAGFDTKAIKGRTGEVRVTAGTDLPASIKPGDVLELRIGFYHPRTGGRLALAGGDDGGRRVRIGSLKLEGNGEKPVVTWAPPAAADRPDPWLARQNPTAKPIDFNAVVLAGGARFVQEEKTLLVTPLPSARGPRATIKISPRANWASRDFRHVQTLSEDGKAGEQQPVKKDGNAIVLECEPGVFAYRLTE